MTRTAGVDPEGEFSDGAGGIRLLGIIDLTVPPTAASAGVTAHVTDSSGDDALAVQWSDGLGGPARRVVDIGTGEIELVTSDGTKSLNLSAFQGLVIRNNLGVVIAYIHPTNALLGDVEVASLRSDSYIAASTLALYGFPATATTPRTLPQATITAITDVNAKAAMQACANALADIGALTLT